MLQSLPSPAVPISKGTCVDRSCNTCISASLACKAPYTANIGAPIAMNGAQMNLVIPQIMPPNDWCQGLSMHLTIRLSDAGMRYWQTKLLYPNHRSPPWLTEDATRDRSNRLLDCRAAPAPKLPLNSAVELTPSLALCKLPTPSTLHHRSTETVQYCADTNEPCAKSRPHQHPLRSVPPKLAALAR